MFFLQFVSLAQDEKVAIMRSASLLIVEDEAVIRDSLRMRLTREGFSIEEAVTVRQARALLKRNHFDVALLDYRLPDENGINLLQEIKQSFPSMVVIIITAFTSVDIAVKAMKMGAADFVTKPFNPDEIVVAIDRATETQQLREEVTRIRSTEEHMYALDALVGKSAVLSRLKELIVSVAQSPATTVMLTGPSGAGKDLIAKIIHYNSPRSNKAFVNITCTAISENLLESELFGHERGAFTDAREQKKGLFEVADGGTIFLDEIGDMPTPLQGKLLRFLEERSFRRVGGTKDISVDVRVISATNRNLRELVARGDFRADLFFRLNSVPIEVPPLRERADDIPLLVDHFIRIFNGELRKSVQGVHSDTLQMLQSYSWPGNVRELRNVMERAMLLGRTEWIELDDLKLEPLMHEGGEAGGERASAASLLGPDGVDLQQVERELVEEAMRRSRGNQSRAALLLRISRDQLRYRLEKFGMLSPAPRHRRRDQAEPV